MFALIARPQGHKSTGADVGSRSLLVQRKLSVNTPGDQYEREADQLADRVMRQGGGPPTAGRSLLPASGVQRVCKNCAQDDDEVVRRSTRGGAVVSGVAAPPIVSRVLSGGGGQPLDGSTRQFMESRIGLDFSQVRIHSGEYAAESASAIQARAYTAGEQVVFGRGEYRLQTEDGQRLLAHELAHVGQQRRAGTRVQRDGAGDVKLSEAFDAAIAAVRATDRFMALSAGDMATAEGIIAELQSLTDRGTKLSYARSLQTLFDRASSKADVDDAKTMLLTLRIDQAMLTALFASLAKPFAGYVASGFDFSDRFFKQSPKLGFSVENPSLGGYKAGPYDRNQPAAVTDPAEESFKKSDILFFSGHQYAQYREPGNFTDDASKTCFNISMLSKENKRVKLVVSTSCATLCKDVAKIWKAKFPDALILGYRFSAPTNGGVVADAFGAKLIALGPITLTNQSDMDKVRKAWKSVVLGGGSIGGGPALLFGDVVEFYEAGKWVSKPWDSAANECHYH
jgi:hypothetical protein